MKLSKYIKDAKMLNLCMEFIDLNEKGLGLGSQISQICAMFYLNRLDHFVKEELHCKLYGRYMDDLYIIEKSKRKLKHCLNEMRKIIKEDKLLLSENKTHIYKLSNGFIFCKIRYFLTKSGKIIRFPKGHSINVFNRKYKKDVSLNVILPSLKSYIANFNCYNYLKKVIMYS